MSINQLDLYINIQPTLLITSDNLLKIFLTHNTESESTPLETS